MCDDDANLKLLFALFGMQIHIVSMKYCEKGRDL